MLQEVLTVFQRMREKNDRLILDEYVPKDGTYRLIELTDDGYQTGKTLYIRYDKKTGEIIGKADSDYPFFCYLDYYSKLIDMNKPMDSSKLIHSNNYLSLFVKKETIKDHKLTGIILEGYYAVLKNPMEKYKKPQAKALYQSTVKETGEIDEELLERIAEYVKEEKVWEDIDFEKKEYIKLFFVYPDREKTKSVYYKEGRRYLLPNIYNSNDYNVEENGVILGLPNNNMGMNAKKPYLPNLGRKVSVPNLVDKEKACLLAEMFDYLGGFASKGLVNVYIDYTAQTIRGYSNTEEPEDLESGYYYRLRKGKELEIHWADTVTNYRKKLDKVFWLRNIIEIQDETLEKFKLEYNIACRQLWELKNIIDREFFENKLSSNFYTDAKDIAITDNVLKRCILETRNRFISWFYTGKMEQISSVIDKVSIELIFNSISSNRILRAQRQFNLRWALLDYLEGSKRRENMVMDVRSQLREHMASKEEWTFSSEEEFSYALGQVVSFLISRSKANKITSSLANPIFTAKNHKIAQKKLFQLYLKYNYDISHKSIGRAELLFNQVMAYVPKKGTRLDREWIGTGFTAQSLIYEKKNTEQAINADAQEEKQ